MARGNVKGFRSQINVDGWRLAAGYYDEKSARKSLKFQKKADRDIGFKSPFVNKVMQIPRTARWGIYYKRR